jgi:hypothetical protein
MRKPTRYIIWNSITGADGESDQETNKEKSSEEDIYAQVVSISFRSIDSVGKTAHLQLQLAQMLPEVKTVSFVSGLGLVRPSYALIDFENAVRPSLAMLDLIIRHVLILSLSRPVRNNAQLETSSPLPCKVYLSRQILLFTFTL